MYANARDVNELRRLLAMGALPADAPIAGFSGPSAAPQENALARMLSEQEQFAAGDQSGPLPMGSMRNEETGRVTYFKPGGGGFSESPYPATGRGETRPVRRVVGFGNGQATDLGEEAAGALPVDYTRPAIDIPGIGKGRYTADGRYAVVTNPDGSQTKVVLGYDAAASDRGRARDLKFREQELRNSLLEEQIGVTKDRRQMLAAGPSIRNTRTDATTDAPAKMTEAQAKAFSFGTRAANSSEIIDLVGKGGEVQPGLIKRSAEAFPLIGEALGTGLNWTQSPEQQQVEQAQRDFINAVLRRESGAVISEGEFANARQQYFPQPGDSTEVIAQKKRNRQLAVEGFAAEVDPVRPGAIKGSAAKARALFDARAAIKQGAPREAVVARLRAAGITEEP